MSLMVTVVEYAQKAKCPKRHEMVNKLLDGLHLWHHLTVTIKFSKAL